MATISQGFLKLPEKSNKEGIGLCMEKMLRWKDSTKKRANISNLASHSSSFSECSWIR